MSTATTTEPATDPSQSRRTINNPTNSPASQLKRSAANRLRTKMAVMSSLLWL